MTNAKIEINSKGIMTITVDVNKEQGMSASGKTCTIATTRGNKGVGSNKAGQEVFVGLNVYHYPE